LGESVDGFGPVADIQVAASTIDPLLPFATVRFLKVR